MSIFTLTATQIGDLAPDGSITRHPDLDIFGASYQRINATRKQLTLGGKRVFVVIPTGKDHEDNEYALAGDTSADLPAPKGKKE